MKNIKPRPLSIRYFGTVIDLKPFDLPISEMKRVRDWLNKCIRWKTERNRK